MCRENEQKNMTSPPPLPLKKKTTIQRAQETQNDLTSLPKEGTSPLTSSTNTYALEAGVPYERPLPSPPCQNPMNNKNKA